MATVSSSSAQTAAKAQGISPPRAIRGRLADTPACDRSRFSGHKIRLV